jgi:hypothetical protein
VSHTLGKTPLDEGSASRRELKCRGTNNIKKDTEHPVADIDVLLLILNIL